MGMTKAVAEKVVQARAQTAYDRSSTVLCCTRYGNVMCSRGSVIPLFIDQIKRKAPITITDPNMTRFLMNLDEAVDLVAFAFEHAEPGDLFIQKGIHAQTKRPQRIKEPSAHRALPGPEIYRFEVSTSWW